MPLSLAALDGVIRESSITVSTKDGEQELKFSYKPNAFTPAMEKETETDRNSNLVGTILNAVLLKVLVWVDLETEPGVTVPITPDGLAKIPLRILNDITAKINESMDPGKK